MNVDVIVTWPKNCDYPIWRQMIRDSRHLFNEIIVVFMETNNGFDYRDFIRQELYKDHVLFVESPNPNGEDWRHVAVTAGLQHSLHSEWLWFTEQDFFWKSGFWNYIESVKNDASVLGVTIGQRLHPCSLFIKRGALQQTKKNFGIVPGKLDHFGLIQKDIEQLGLPKATIPEELYYHMNGLSHNMTLLERGETPNYMLDDFIKYMRDSMKTTVKRHEYYEKIFHTYIGNKSE